MCKAFETRSVPRSGGRQLEDGNLPVHRARRVMDSRSPFSQGQARGNDVWEHRVKSLVGMGS